MLTARQPRRPRDSPLETGRSQLQQSDPGEQNRACVPNRSTYCSMECPREPVIKCIGVEKRNDG